jgi:hypothetical protein
MQAIRIDRENLTARIWAPWNQPADVDVDNGGLDYDPCSMHFNYVLMYSILILSNE